MRALMVVWLCLTGGVAAYAGQPLTVCELLARLDDLNGKEVTVQGTWGIGDMGEVLMALRACERRTVRDGWIWQDAIHVFADTKEAAAGKREYWRLAGRMEESSPDTPCRIVATFTGRVETRHRFNLYNGRPGVTFVAQLRYRSVGDLKVVPYEAGEQEWELELRRRPAPRRVERDSR